MYFIYGEITFNTSDSLNEYVKRYSKLFKPVCVAVKALYTYINIYYLDVAF